MSHPRGSGGVVTIRNDFEAELAMMERAAEQEREQLAMAREVAEMHTNPKQIYGDRKVPMHLVPSAGQIHEALAFGEGARKYGPYNWRETKVEAMTYIGAAQRHILAYLDGEEFDPETVSEAYPSGLHHLGLARASLGILLDCTENGTMIDNRPPPGEAGPVLRVWRKV